jgi:L,D-peptidoglycan transpeptidase YkuD (ErfK/YbiS/YcfS/YnhG family)
VSLFILPAICAWLGYIPLASSTEQACPPALAEATRLLLVTTPDMDSVDAALTTFVRQTAAAPWQRRSGPEPAVVGKAGFGWGLSFRDQAAPGEKLKLEGDKRAPAGIFAVGVPFGFAADDRPGYLQIKQGVQICVDDPASPFYGQIVSMAEAGGASSEIMAEIPLYERGLVVDYPISREARSGSCIFVHIWGGKGEGTVGCVTAPKATVAALQDFAGPGATAIAILPENAKSRFPGCLP